MRASHPLLRKVEQAAIKYHQALQGVFASHRRRLRLALAMLLSTNAPPFLT